MLVHGHTNSGQWCACHHDETLPSLNARISLKTFRSSIEPTFDSPAVARAEPPRYMEMSATMTSSQIPPDGTKKDCRHAMVSGMGPDRKEKIHTRPAIFGSELATG